MGLNRFMMRGVMAATLIGIFHLSPLSHVAAQTSEHERLVIGLDLSESNPLVANEQYAAKLSERVGDKIRSLSLKSEVLIRTFGVVDSTRNTLQINEIVSMRNRPEAIARSAEVLISNVPGLVAQGQFETQEETNIIGFIQTMVQAIGECETKTTFILLTDGLEDSSYARLKDPNAHLPLVEIKPPDDRRRKCHELQILGLGEGLNNVVEVERIRTEWQNWATGRGRPFKRFIGLRDW